MPDSTTMIHYLILVGLATSGSGFVSNRTARNPRDLVTLDVLGDGQNGLVFDLVPDIDEDIQIETHECPPCLCLMDNPGRDNYILEKPMDSKRVTSTLTTSSSTKITTTTAGTTSTTTSDSTTSTTKSIKITTNDNNLTSSANGEETKLVSNLEVTTSNGPTHSTKDTKSNITSECKDNSEGNLCLSESCVMAAGTILTSLDRTVDPCDDFFQFACGGWAQRSPVLNMDRFQATV